MRIDLAADVGEGFADELLLPFLSSVHIACGAHAGDLATMRRTARLALERGLTLGAHPGYPDRERFGRFDLELPPAALAASLAEQLAALTEVVASLGGRLRQVKPHGALYNRAARDPEVAARFAAAVAAFDPALAVVGPPGSALLAAAAARQLATLREGFVDRGYLADGTLAPRGSAGALLAVDAAVAQAVALARRAPIPALSGTRLTIEVDTLGLHGDSPRAAQLAAAVRGALEGAGIAIAPCRS